MQVRSSKEKLKAGNDAHYTLVAFKAMCTKNPKVGHVIEEKAPRFSIRDLVPDDLIVKPTNEKSPGPPSIVDLKLTLSDFLGGPEKSKPQRTKIMAVNTIQHLPM